MSETLHASEGYSRISYAISAARALRGDETAPLGGSAVENSMLSERVSIDTRVGDQASTSPRLTLRVELSREVRADRRDLLRKRFIEGLTPNEELRLRYLEWQVESATSSEVPAGVVQLESLMEKFEVLAKTVEHSVAAERDRFPKAFPKRR